jgi:hypothetical protein
MCIKKQKQSADGTICPRSHINPEPVSTPSELAFVLEDASPSALQPAILHPSVTHGTLSPATNTTLYLDLYHEPPQKLCRGDYADRDHEEDAQRETDPSSLDQCTFTPATSDSLILGPYHGPENKPCRCRGLCRGDCNTVRMEKAAREALKPKQCTIVRDETFRSLMDDRVGTQHTSELQPD